MPICTNCATGNHPYDEHTGQTNSFSYNSEGMGVSPSEIMPCDCRECLDN